MTPAQTRCETGKVSVGGYPFTAALNGQRSMGGVGNKLAFQAVVFT